MFLNQFSMLYYMTLLRHSELKITENSRTRTKPRLKTETEREEASCWWTDCGEGQDSLWLSSTEGVNPF